MPRFRCLLGALLGASLTGHAERALAADGVIEINQTRALAGGVTPGDTAGFPVTISLPGAYQLTSNLDVRGQPSPENVTAIEVTGKDATIDLGGFAILGPEVYPFGSACPFFLFGGTGVNAVDAAIVVRNGHVRGMGGYGVRLQGRISRIEAVTAEENCQVGLLVGTAGIIAGSQARGNGSNGISTGDSGRVQDSIADLNGSSGILTGSASVVTGCVATSNSASGIAFYGPGVALANVLVGNAGAGIIDPAGQGVLVMQNTMSGNSAQAHYGFGDGVGYNVFKSNGGGGSTGVSTACNVLDGVAYCPSHP